LLATAWNTPPFYGFTVFTDGPFVSAEVPMLVFRLTRRGLARRNSGRLPLLRGDGGECALSPRDSHQLEMSSPPCGSLHRKSAVAAKRARKGGTVDDQVITGYAPVNGVDVYWESRGSGGTPLVLVHGG
jgi:hypothetical protein